MRVRRVDRTETAVLDRVFEIHDEIPRQWDATHRAKPEFLRGLRERVQAEEGRHGIWVLDDGGPIVGMLWATLKDGPIDGTPYCSINSFWIAPELRHQKHAPALTEACLLWARERGARRFECNTHQKNARMRAILEKNGFEPGMIQYVLPISPP